MTPSPTDLEAQAAAVEAGLVHGGVLLHEPPAQDAVLQGVQLPVAVVVEQALGEVEEGAELAQGAAVGLHLGGVVLRPEEGPAAAGGDVAAFVDDVEEAGLQHLRETTWRPSSNESCEWWVCAGDVLIGEREVERG